MRTKTAATLVQVPIGKITSSKEKKTWAHERIKSKLSKL